MDYDGCNLEAAVRSGGGGTYDVYFLFTTNPIYIEKGKFKYFCSQLVLNFNLTSSILITSSITSSKLINAFPF